MNPEELIVEARAKIIWGDEPSSVHEYLTSNGMSAADASREVQEFVADRNKEIRKLGVRDTCIGVAILCVVALGLWYELEHPSRRVHSRRAEAMTFLGLAGLYGIWKLIDGLFHLLRPQADTRSIPDMTE
jgi:hypothetical protein